MNDWSQKELSVEAAKLIVRALPFSEVSLALRIPNTKTFKYEALVGFKQAVVDEMSRKTYSEEDATGHDREPCIRIDSFLDFELAEGTTRIDHEYEHLQYNRPTRLLEARKALDEMKDGDYLALFFRGIRGELLGYVELEAPRNRKLPEGKLSVLPLSRHISDCFTGKGL